MEPNEIWAYRKTGKHPLVPVRFLRHRRGTGRKNEYSLVRFEDPKADGLEEWVPDGRLKCLWTEADAFQGTERRWAAIREASREGEGVVMAIDQVLFALLPDEMWGDASGPRPHHPNEGVYAFSNLDALAKLTGLSVDEICGAPTVFEQNGGWVVPVATALRIAERLAPQDPATVIRQVEREERELTGEQEDWWLRSPRTGPGRQTEDWWEARRHSLNLRREWVGENNNSLREDALAAQAESERLRGLVVWAIKKLAGYGHKSSAETLRRYMDGTPVPTSRPSFMPEP